MNIDEATFAVKIADDIMRDEVTVRMSDGEEAIARQLNAIAHGLHVIARLLATRKAEGV